MKICYYGNFTEAHTTESYIGRALERAGVIVQYFQERDTPDQLLDRLPDADVFLFAKGRFHGQWDSADGIQILNYFPQIRQRCKKIVCWVFDLLNHDFSTSRFHWASQVSAQCDLFCTTDGSTAPRLFNCKVLRQGIGDDVRPGVFRQDMACDVLFLGEAYGKRGELLDALSAKFHRRLWYVPRGYRGDILNDVMASAKVVVGPYWPYFPDYESNRVYIVAGYGGKFVAPRGQCVEPHLCHAFYPIDNVANHLEFILHNLKDYGSKSYSRPTVPTYDDRAKQLLEWIA